MRHRGGGARKLLRKVDFGQEKLNRKGTVTALEYDPNRNAFLALVEYENGEQGYILAPHELAVGEEIVCAPKTEIKTGSRLQLGNIPAGTQTYNIEVEPGKGGKLVRGAGGAATVLGHEGSYTLIQLPSSESRKVLSRGYASIGTVSNPEHRYKKARKAGSARKKGKRPEVRGTVMNPVDHPHGGGEGRTGRGMKHPKTPWGKPALGVKTRKKKWSDKLILQRRKRKKRK